MTSPQPFDHERMAEEAADKLFNIAAPIVREHGRFAITWQQAKEMFLAGAAARAEFDAGVVEKAIPEWDCGDNSCRFAKNKSGMRTNGGCRCLDGCRDSKVRLAFIRCVALLEQIAAGRGK